MTEQTFSLTSPQLGIWIDQTVRRDAARYILGGYIEIFGAVSPELCERAINCLVEKHEILRIRLEQTESGIPVQRFVDRLSLVMPFQDLTGEDDASETAVRLIQIEM